MTDPLRELTELIARVAETLRTDDAAARARAATDIAALEATLARLPAPPGFDPAQIGDALRRLGAWLRAPTDAGAASAEDAITELQASLGVRVGGDPAHEDAARRAQYRREARATLDAIFSAKPEKP